MIQISNNVSISEDEIELKALRSQGPGGQHVNKVSTAIQLRFDIFQSSLPDIYKTKLMALNDGRITDSGMIVLTAQSHRSQQQNRLDAVERLCDLLRKAMITQRKRRPTAPSRNARKRRMDSKNKRGQLKKLRSSKIKSSDY